MADDRTTQNPGAMPRLSNPARSAAAAVEQLGECDDLPYLAHTELLISDAWPAGPPVAVAAALDQTRDRLGLSRPKSSRLWG